MDPPSKSGKFQIFFLNPSLTEVIKIENAFFSSSILIDLVWSENIVYFYFSGDHTIMATDLQPIKMMVVRPLP